MLTQIMKLIEMLKANKWPRLAIATAASIAGSGALVAWAQGHSIMPELRTLAFFMLTEAVVISACFGIATLCYRRKALRIYLRRALGNLLLGMHLAAGMVVLGVYFTV